MKEKLKIKGKILIRIRDENGNIKSERIEKNLVVNAGLNLIVARMIDNSQSVISHIELGSGSTLPSGVQTTLQSVISGSRVGIASLAQYSDEFVSDSIQIDATFSPGVGTGVIRELGTFNASSAGVMFSRAIIDPITKDALDTMEITWIITFE